MPAKHYFLASFMLFSALSVAQNVPNSSHVWIIAEENHSFEQVVGNPEMPYFNQLAEQYGLATQFYADQHSSLPALMWYVAGAPVEKNNGTVSCQHADDNVVRELLSQGYTWRSYQENLPYAGYQGLFGGSDRVYYRRHNPLIDFTDVCPGTGQDTNSVPLTQMAADFANGQTPNFAWITPDVNDDAHNGTLASADQWLQTYVPTILAQPAFSAGGDGILFIVWDESRSGEDSCSATDKEGCGGHVATLVIGPNVAAGYQSTTTYYSESVLATVCAAMGLTTCPGAAATAPAMAEFFGTSTPITQPTGISFTTPANGSTISGEVLLIANANDQTAASTQVWDNGVELGTYGIQANDVYTLSTGSHTTTVSDFDSSGNLLNQASVTYNVQPLVDGLEIMSPTANEVFPTTSVQVVAHASESVPVSQVQVWDNGKKLGRYDGSDVNQYFTLSPGTHTLTFTDHDENFQLLHQTSVTYLVR